MNVGSDALHTVYCSTVGYSLFFPNAALYLDISNIVHPKMFFCSG